MPKYSTISLPRDNGDIGCPINNWQATNYGLTKEYQIMLINTTRVPNNGNITIDDYSPTSRTGNNCPDNPVNYRSFRFESKRAVSDQLKMIQFDENLIDY